jgi:hypothetical protein
MYEFSLYIQDVFSVENCLNSKSKQIQLLSSKPTTTQIISHPPTNIFMNRVALSLCIRSSQHLGDLNLMYLKYRIPSIILSPPSLLPAHIATVSVLCIEHNDTLSITIGIIFLLGDTVTLELNHANNTDSIQAVNVN